MDAFGKNIAELFGLCTKDCVRVAALLPKETGPTFKSAARHFGATSASVDPKKPGSAKVFGRANFSRALDAAIYIHAMEKTFGEKIDIAVVSVEPAQTHVAVLLSASNFSRENTARMDVGVKAHIAGALLTTFKRGADGEGYALSTFNNAVTAEAFVGKLRNSGHSSKACVL